MENLKVKVNNEAESKEAQELFFELGFKWIDIGAVYYKTSPNFKYITAYHDGKTLAQGNGVDAKKQITIPQLRDMVVLKRNCVDDATHTGRSGSQYYIGEKSYFWDGVKWEQRDFSNLGHLKPIKEKEMKEFLVNHGDKWTLQLLDADTEENSFRVAVPSGADIYWQEDDEYWFTTELMGYRDAEIVWQRYTQPEELPFIDDEPKSLNDTYAEIEQVRQDAINNPTHYTNGNIECLDAMQAMLSPDEFIGFLRGNIFKYQWRYKLKNGVEDLKKAQFYQNKLIELESKD